MLPRSLVVLVLSFVLTGCAVSTGQWFDSQRHNKQTFFNRFFFDAEKRKAPDSGEVTVEKGDTYYSIAQTYDVAMSDLVSENVNVSAYDLKEGQKIRLPQSRAYTVQKGDTLYSIARRYEVNVTKLAAHNNLSSPYTLSVGQEIYFPQGISGDKTKLASADPTGTRVVTRPTAIRDRPPKSAGRFRSPVNGQVISRFGPKSGGLHNDGVNIKAPLGTPVKASENGIVIYAGNELQGYGNLILIRHEGGWVSAYAHNHEFKVKPGDKVKQGQEIASVGQTGNVTEPQLHFELRRNAKAVDPSQFLYPAEIAEK